MTHRFQVLRAALTALLLLTGSASTRAQDAPATVVAFGDSLTAGLGVGPGESFPEQLQAALAAKGVAASVANAGVSGDTTSGGLQRLDWSVPDGTDLVILELGANDALRGVPPAITEKNLDAMLARLKARRIPVVVAGMLSPPNMGPDYAAAFNPIFGRLAAKYDAPLYPFFLDGVAAAADLNQPDGMHPTKKGVAVIVERILPTVIGALDAGKASQGSAG